MKPAWAALIFLIMDASAFAQKPPGVAQLPAEKLSSQAQTILRKYCFECHGQDPKNLQAKINVLDHRSLLDRKIVVPAAPDESELIGSIVDGTMPTGKRAAVPKDDLAVLREWVRSGAPPFPAGASETPETSALGHSYVLQEIWEDVRKQPVGDRPFVRYFSLNHLLGDPKTKADLGLFTEALTKAIQHLSRKGKEVAPVPIDDTKTVFRVDISKLGWDDKPLEIIKDEERAGGSGLTLFDLILLEYPYGFVGPNTPVFDKLARDFLEPANQVRPLAYVRGDWFIYLAAHPAFCEDFLQLPSSERGKQRLDPQVTAAARRFGEAALSLEVVSAELGSVQPTAELKALLRGPPFERLDLRLANGTISRQTWDSYFASVVKELTIGTPLTSLDGLMASEIDSQSPIDVALKTNHDDNVFAPKSDIEIIVSNKTKAVIYVELTVANKLRKGILRKPSPLKPDGLLRYPDKTSTVEGKEEVTVLACENQLSPGDVVRAKNMTDRIVHPCFELQRKGERWQVVNDPGKWIKKKIEIETRTGAAKDER
jgi:hypothetical protein